ncbi:MAG: glycosyltransferase [Acidimicrobiales bacterium]
MAQRALILSGSLGMGHDVLAAACTEVLFRHGWEARTVSSMALLGPVRGDLGERAFRKLISFPGLYDGLHFAGLRPGTRVATAMDRAAKHRLVPALRAELERYRPDLLLAVFAAGASAVAELGHSIPDRHTVVLCNDVTLHRLWVWEGIDLFCVTSPAAMASVRRFLPRAQVAVIPPPVRAQFGTAHPQAEARRSFDVPQDVSCVILIGGGWGLGPLAETAEKLATEGVHVLAVAGHNRALEAQLRALAARRGPQQALIHPFGFSDRIPELMAAADLVIAHAGASTCAEARAVRRPLLILDVIPGHGRENLLHELELGGADACNAKPAEIVACALAILDRVPRPAPLALPSPQWGAELVGALSSIGVKIGR